MKTLKNRIDKTWAFFKEVFNEFDQDNCFRLAAALSYYTLFSIAPIIIIVIATAGYLFGKEAIKGEIYFQIKDLIGSDGAKIIQTMVESAYLEKSGFIPTVLGVGTLLFSSTVTFTVLQDSLNTIWKVRVKPERGFVKFLVTRVLSFALVLAIGVLLIIMLMVNTLLVAFRNFLTDILELDVVSIYLIEIMQLLVSVGMVTLLFAMLFKFLPDIKLRWRNVWKGSLFTAILFNIGKHLIGLYLGQSSISSAYGAAGSLVLIILWINYSAWIFFLGAEFIYVNLRQRGVNLAPTKYAVRIMHVESEDPNTEAKPLA